MKKLGFAILSAGFLSAGNIFCSGLLGNMWNFIRGTANQPAQPRAEGLLSQCYNALNHGRRPEKIISEEESVLEEVHSGAAPNVFTDHDRCMHVHNNHFPRDKTDQVETMVVWYPHYERTPEADRYRNCSFPKVRNAIIKCSSSVPSYGKYPELAQIYFSPQQEQFYGVTGNLKQVHISLLCDVDFEEYMPTVKINFAVPQE